MNLGVSREACGTHGQSESSAGLGEAHQISSTREKKTGGKKRNKRRTVEAKLVRQTFHMVFCYRMNKLQYFTCLGYFDAKIAKYNIPTFIFHAM